MGRSKRTPPEKSSSTTIDNTSYATWQKFEHVIRKAQDDFLALGGNADDHFTQTVKKVSLGSNATREVLNYELTRAACYMVALNCQTEEGGRAKGYFAAQTRRAELLLPPSGFQVPQLRPWSERLSVSYQVHRRNVNRMFPYGSFTTYTATAIEILMIEDELIRHEMPLKCGDLPDGSIGKRWANECRG